MAPPPIHRRIAFWLGLFILASLIWAGIAGGQRETGLSWGSTKRSINVCSLSGVIEIIHVRDLTTTGTGLPSALRLSGFSTFSGPPAPRSQSPVTFLRNDIDSLYRYDHLTIAWWFITLLHLIAWSATLTWLHRRQRALLENA